MSGDRRKGGRGKERVEVEERGREGGRGAREYLPDSLFIFSSLHFPVSLAFLLSPLPPPAKEPTQADFSSLPLEFSRSRISIVAPSLSPSTSTSPLPPSPAPPSLSSPLTVCNMEQLEMQLAGTLHRACKTRAAFKFVVQDKIGHTYLHVRLSFYPFLPKSFLSHSSQCVTSLFLLPPSPNLFSCLSLLLCPSLSSLISCSLPLHCNYCTLRHKY